MLRKIQFFRNIVAQNTGTFVAQNTDFSRNCCAKYRTGCCVYVAQITNVAQNTISHLRYICFCGDLLLFREGGRSSFPMREYIYICIFKNSIRPAEYHGDVIEARPEFMIVQNVNN